MTVPVIVLDTKGRCNDSNLNLFMDEACLDVRSDALDPLTIWSLSDECEKVDMQNKYQAHLVWFAGGGRVGARLNSQLTLVVVFCTFFILTLLSWATMCVLRSEWLANLKQRNVPFSELESDLGTPSTDGAPPMVRSELLAVRREKTRLRSLDVFRGICIAVMIFVNYGGGQYWFFKHSTWNGLTIADLVLVDYGCEHGAIIALTTAQFSESLEAVQEGSIPIHRFGDFRHTTQLYCKCKTHQEHQPCQLKTSWGASAHWYGPWLVLQDVLESWLQWLVILGLVATHTCLTFLLPVEGCPTGYLGPGGSYNYSSHPNCTGGAAGYIDRMVFRNEHLYQKPTCYEIYQTTLPYDPEGLLGTLTSILMVYLGVQAGRITLCYHYAYSRVVRWTTWAIITGLLAGCLCNFSRSDGVVPVNKNLWSVSYVLATASLAFMLQCILYIWVDVKRWMSCNLFRFAGMNAILLYVGHELTHGVFPWGWQPYYHTHMEYLLMALWGSCLWVFIAFVLFKRNIFLTI
uniref:Heparan-alpha-glucosaminide N-acetyltransferase n=1 Tax=Timema monikensis TaxID=170555 RepID=A0A7R9EHF9_9NEOP|nr:unnamed protein product [Timema monikensis]